MIKVGKFKSITLTEGIDPYFQIMLRLNSMRVIHTKKINNRKSDNTIQHYKKEILFENTFSRE